MTTAPGHGPAPDEVLLRRFGLVRAVGGAAYFLAVAVLAVPYGSRVWPLLLGVPVLAVVTTTFFLRSSRAPRALTAVSLAADAIVIAGTVLFLGGTSSGAIALYAIPVVSAGIVLGTGAALGFLAFAVALALGQLGLEQLGVEPVVLYRPDLGDRLGVLAITLAALGSVGYLTATYAGRLHELIDEAGSAAETTRVRGRRRRQLLQRSAVAVGPPLRAVEAVADELDAESLTPAERVRLAARLRDATAALAGEVTQLADAGVIDVAEESRLQPLSLRRIAEDAVAAVGHRLSATSVDLEVGDVTVLGVPRLAQRVVVNLLENVVEHTPAGTGVSLRARTAGPQGVLVVADDGPGIPPGLVPHLFEPGDGVARVGLPLVAELCAAMGAQVRCEPPRSGTGARFLVAFRLAPRGAPTSPRQAPRPPEVGAAASDA